MNSRRFVIFAAALVIPAVVLAQSPQAERIRPGDQFARFLLPVYNVYPMPGAPGVMFQTMLLVYSATPFRFYPAESGSTGPGTFIPPDVGPGWGTLPLEGNYANFDSTMRELGSGIWLYIERSALDRVTFDYSVISQTATAQSSTELPVVPESSFTTMPLSFLGVTADCGNRSLLRIYALDPLPDAEVDVTQWWSSLSVPRASNTKRVRITQSDHPDAPLLFPSYAVVDLQSAPFLTHVYYRSPQCLSTRFEVVPVTPGLRVWAFVSTTDNATQQVRIIEPRTFATP